MPQPNRKLPTRPAKTDLPDTTDLQNAAALLFGELGEWSYEAHRALSGLLPGFGTRVPLIWTRMFSFSHCIGLTTSTGVDFQQITLSLLTVREDYDAGAERDIYNGAQTAGILAHEMIHAHLIANGLDSKHAGKEFPRIAQEISRELGATEEADLIQAVHPRRINRKLVYSTPDNSYHRTEMARWPVAINSLNKPAGWLKDWKDTSIPRPKRDLDRPVLIMPRTLAAIAALVPPLPRRHLVHLPSKAD